MATSKIMPCVCTTLCDSYRRRVRLQLVLLSSGAEEELTSLTAVSKNIRAKQLRIHRCTTALLRGRSAWAGQQTVGHCLAHLSCQARPVQRPFSTCIIIIIFNANQSLSFLCIQGLPAECTFLIEMFPITRGTRRPDARRIATEEAAYRKTPRVERASAVPDLIKRSSLSFFLRLILLLRWSLRLLRCCNAGTC